MTSIDHLPHREPFLFVTRLCDVERGRRITGEWVVTGREDFFRGHFPQCALVPGVLLGEALAQISGLIGIERQGERVRLAQIDLKFPASVTPPATIALRSSLTRGLGSLHFFEVAAESEGVLVAQGSLVLIRGAQA